MDNDDSKKRKKHSKSNPPTSMSDKPSKSRKRKKSIQSDSIASEEIITTKKKRTSKDASKKNKKKSKKAVKKGSSKRKKSSGQDEVPATATKMDKKKKMKVKKTTVDAESSLKQKKMKKKKKESASKKGGKKQRSNGTSVDGGSIDAYRKKNEIAIFPAEDASISPFITFAEARVHYPPELISMCDEQFDAPTPIQAQCWPIAAAKRDIIGVAETGSGKTLGFLVPAFAHILNMNGAGKAKSGKPKVLVLAPTRELATQITEVAVEFGSVIGIRSVTVYGGVPKGPQISTLKRGVDIVIATPGRLLDLTSSGLCDLSGVGYLILDEADQMLDLGFEPDIRAIVKCLKDSSSRRTLMFTATWPMSIQKLAHKFLSSPVRVNIGEASTLNANTRIKQIVKVVDPKAKDRMLEQLLTEVHGEQQSKILVFALYKKEAVRVGNNLLRRGWNCATIQGDLNQHDRSKCIENFKNGSVPLLVATDVAARGIDVPDVQYVINYTFPLTVEQYVHRIGRTGRAGKRGTAYTFFTQYDKAHTGELVNVLRDADQHIPEDLLKFGVAVKRKEHPVYGAHYRDTSGVTKKASHVKF